MKTNKLLMLLAAATFLPGCAPYIGSCSWVEPDAGTAFDEIAPREAIPEECNCIGCDAPGRFVLERENYTLELWNGDRWYSQLYLRGRSTDGASLVLSSDSPELRRMAPHVPSRDTHGFEYFMHFTEEDAERSLPTLIIRVIGTDGNVLGVEAIKLKVVTKKDLAIEYI